MAIKVNNVTVIDDSRTLVNITGIKTIGGKSILGTGDIPIIASAAVGDTAPASPGSGAFWWDSASGQLYLHYQDADSSQWVPAAIGDQGPSGTVALGTTTYVNPDISPSVTNTGTSSSALLNFSLPRASVISVGTTSTGLPGTSASVTNTGTNGDAVLNFTVPRGASVALDATPITTLLPNQVPTVTDQNAGGDVSLRFGIPRAATVAIGTVTTVSPATSAAVTNTGTNGDVVLNFSVPKGDKGDPGQGTVDGPASSSDSTLAAFDGTTGKLIKGTGIVSTTVATTGKAIAMAIVFG